MDLATLRRGVRRVCFGAAAGCAVLATVGSPVLAQSTDDEAGPRPEVFSGAASALGASVAFDRPGLLPLEHVFTYIVADGVGTYRTSEQRGRASLFFPGNGLIQGPALACSQFPPEAEPVFGPILAACAQYSFPLSVATDSLTPDGATEGSLQLGEPTDPISANGVGARSHAGEDSVTTNAEISDFRMLGSPAIGPLPAVPGFEDLDPYLITIGGVTAVTDQRIDADGALVVDAASAVSDIGLVGGLVNIGSVVSRARIVDGEEEPVTETSLEVSGVTVAGMPAQLTEDGLQLSTASQPLGPQLEALTNQLGTALESLSFRMETLGVEQGVDEDGISFARVGGVLISMSVPVGGLAPVPGPLGDIDLNGDYQGTMVLGQVGARAIAGSFDSEAAGTTGGGASPVASGAGGSTGSGGSTGGGTGRGAGSPRGRHLRRPAPRPVRRPTQAPLPRVHPRRLRHLPRPPDGTAGPPPGAAVMTEPTRPTAPRRQLKAQDAPSDPAPTSPSAGVASASEPAAAERRAGARSEANPYDEEPDPRLLWQWVGKAGRPWAGWGFIVVGLLITLIGWIGVSGEAVVAKQIPYVVSGGIGGVLLAVIGAYFLGTEELRKDSGRLDRLEQKVDELHAALLQRPDAPAPAAGPPGNGSSHEPESVLVVTGGETFHAHGCPMAAGKDTEEMAVAAATKRGLSACPLCSPTLVS